MVTRVDKKPIIYNTCLLRALKPAVISSSKGHLERILSLSRGHNIPKVSAREVLDDYEDIEYGMSVFGIDDPAYEMFGHGDDEEDDEAIRIARVCLDRGKTARQLLKSQALMEEVVKIQARVLAGVDRIYYGTEAVYQLYNRALWGEVFESPKVPDYSTWCNDTAKRILVMQSAYMFIHPIAMHDMAEGLAQDCNYNVWYAWDMFKKLETISIRIGSRKNMLAHAYYSGVNKKGFTPSKTPEKDFKMPLTGYCQVKDTVSMYMILGLRYYVINGLCFVLTHDDCINLASMAQCYFRTAMYFTPSNGYKAGAVSMALGLVKDIAAHCCRLIDAGKNFSHAIRSMHILSQGEFNDAFEESMGTDLGWRERSANYTKEAAALDPLGSKFHRRATALACDNIDKLNTCFIYHAFIGDEMLVTDLRDKVKNMTKKVMPADAKEWANFINFVKAYTLSRFMMVNKKKPSCRGEITLLNEKWAERCVSGQFTMPPQADWGKVWISGEFKYTDFADTWHLEAQDVAYVVKDSKGLVNSKYISDKKIHSELLMAMTGGDVLDTLTGSTPRSARERVCGRGEVKEVVLTTAPKAENAKPSWKKRVTFAADCEFRKLQAEYDRNCRRVMSFIRGPSLGVDQCILEKQFSDICMATGSFMAGAVCSHDISAWSESMDRERKFEFEDLLIGMFDKPEMINIKDDWQKINAVVSKQGCKEVIKVDNGSFQGFDGSSSTLLHSMILIYCLDTARRAAIIPSEVKTNMATLIDDCIALMVDLDKPQDANNFWTHLKATYLKLGFEVDDLKSIFSTIKAIYLSRRFLLGGEVPADLKVFLKAHSSYEDPLRCSLDIPGDIFGAMRGACDANGEPWFIYYCACVSVLAELAHTHGCIKKIPPAAAAVFALAPVQENGWGFPSVTSWCTNDITDKRSHFNAILESAAVHACQSADFIRGIDVFPRTVAKAVHAIKSQAWRLVSYSAVFTSPFEAIREGPLKPDMLRRNAVQDMLEEVATAEPWVSLLKWNKSDTTTRVRELLIQSGPLHAPTLAALVNCMPDNYRLSLVGKAIGSQSLLSLLSNAKMVIVKRRIHKCTSTYFQYSKALYESSNEELLHDDFAALTYLERSVMEREEFFGANGVRMIDHTFPDPIATFTVSSIVTGSVISPNLSGLRIWDKGKHTAHRTSHFVSGKGMYVPRKSGRVWEVTCEYAKGWDSVSQRVAMGLAVIARAEADGHQTEGLLVYFIKSWNELSNITPRDTHLIAIHGSIKRLDANPGSSTHPIIANRNILLGFNNKLKSALDSIPAECEKNIGSSAHLHDFLAHETAMLTVTALMFSLFQCIGKLNHTLSYNMATRQGCVMAESEERMKTDLVANKIQIEIMDGADNYGLLQSCPNLASSIAIPTMKASWVGMINALIDRDTKGVEDLRLKAYSTPLEELLEELARDEVCYTSSIIIAADPAARRAYTASDLSRVTLAPTPENARAAGDMYTMSVRTIGSKFTRALSEHHPAHILAATAIRSLVWDRLKASNCNALAKILYMDPDADTTIIKRCSSPDFWRGAVAEVSRVCKGKALSDMTMSAFKSLGIPEIHLNHSNDVMDLSHAVASFFGAHLRSVLVIIADLITSVAGRSSADFAKPFTERVVTNNPSVLNAKLRKEHIKRLIDSTIKGYSERINDILEGEPKHRGDKRIAIDQRHARVVELRCRNYVYKSLTVDDSGKATLDEAKFSAYIYDASISVFERLNIPPDEAPQRPTGFEDTLWYMHTAKEKMRSLCPLGNDGWEPYDGSIGARLAYEQIMMDSDMVMNTKFAVSASEVAPKLHRKILVTPASSSSKPVPTADPAELAFLGDPDLDGDDGVDIFGIGDDDLDAFYSTGPMKLPIPKWQALYALLISGVYSTDDVNAALGTSMSGTVGPTMLREAHLEDFTDDVLDIKLPKIVGDYFSGGIVFDPDWLDRDEADAYTTDEMNTVRGGFLF